MVDVLQVAIAINIAAGDEAKGVALARCVWCLEEQDPGHAWTVYPVRGGCCGSCPVNGRDVLLVMRPKEKACPQEAVSDQEQEESQQETKLATISTSVSAANDSRPTRKPQLAKAGR